MDQNQQITEELILQEHEQIQDLLEFLCTDEGEDVLAYIAEASQLDEKHILRTLHKLASATGHGIVGTIHGTGLGAYHLPGSLVHQAIPQAILHLTGNHNLAHGLLAAHTAGMIGGGAIMGGIEGARHGWRSTSDHYKYSDMAKKERSNEFEARRKKNLEASRTATQAAIAKKFKAPKVGKKRRAPRRKKVVGESMNLNESMHDMHQHLYAGLEHLNACKNAKHEKAADQMHTAAMTEFQQAQDIAENGGKAHRHAYRSFFKKNTHADQEHGYMNYGHEEIMAGPNSSPQVKSKFHESTQVQAVADLISKQAVTTSGRINNGYYGSRLDETFDRSAKKYKPVSDDQKAFQAAHVSHFGKTVSTNPKMFEPGTPNHLLATRGYWHKRGFEVGAAGHKKSKINIAPLKHHSVGISALAGFDAGAAYFKSKNKK